MGARSGDAANRPEPPYWRQNRGFLTRLAHLWVAKRSDQAMPVGEEVRI